MIWRNLNSFSINTFAKSGKRDRAFVVWSEITTNQKLHKAHAGYFTAFAMLATVSDRNDSWTIRANHRRDAGDDRASDHVGHFSVGRSGGQLSNGAALFLQQRTVGRAILAIFPSRIAS